MIFFLPFNVAFAFLFHALCSFMACLSLTSFPVLFLFFVVVKENDFLSLYIFIEEVDFNIEICI